MEYDTKCPNCEKLFDSHAEGNFWWGPDEDNHPTVENMRCPHCGASTESSFSCQQCPLGIANKCDLEEECAACTKWNYDDFEYVEEQDI